MPKKKAKRKRKHKKRSSTKAGYRRGKAKSKGKKSKKKNQKPKETFHWQPPLEFGEEEEEEKRPEENVTVKQVVKEGLLKLIGETAVKHKESKSSAEETHKTPKENFQSGAASQRAQEQSTKNEQESKQSPTNVKSPRRGESTEAEFSETDGKELAEEFPEKTEQSDDSMEICTPEQNTPERDYAKTTPQQGSPLKEHVRPANRDTENALNTTVVEALKMEPHPMNSRASSNVLISNDSGDENDKAQNELQCLSIDPKWKPLKDLSNQQPVSTMNAVEGKSTDASGCVETKPQGLRIEIKSKSRVRPGSLFDEVRKTAMNQRQRNKESSSEERSPSVEDKSKSRSRTRSPSKSGSSQRTRSRTRSLSSSRSRTRSRSSTYSYSSRTYSRSRSRSRSSDRRRRSRSVTYDSYYNRSRSRSSRRRRSDSYRTSRSYDRSSRSYRSYSRSDRSYSRRRSHS
ncbi:NK-tumor recognition protein-like isoform X1 [Acipenser ruthenus]|uniref:NK-tumor recognition protein-like isoform X1 n=1 Tax=Acipenser ruthenus TaxID=7906 RepID=UPI002740F121|nr:NK-tumor recognition protein-like isoform X1 [Acipenser ruthenus]